MARIVHASTSDTHGGAARAAFRLHTGLLNAGYDSLMVVQDKRSADRSVYGPANKLSKLVAQFRPYIDLVPAAVCRYEHKAELSPAIVPGKAVSEINKMNADIIHLHWISKGFIRIEALKGLKNKPIVWTLHDSWAFTGGCHVPYDCTKYKEKCGGCPILPSDKEYDLSRWVWRRKKKTFGSLDLTIVTPSKWLGECAKQSSLFQGHRIEVIPNGIDTNSYKPLNRELCREALGLPLDKTVIMFGAMYSTSDKNKGFAYLVSALKKTSETSLKNDVVAVVMGANAPYEQLNIGIDIHYLGHLHDDASLYLAYSSADVFVAPSKQENLPNTVMEAMACGVPCVAFNVGGMPDMIEHQKTGYLAVPYDIDDLARGLQWVIGNSDRRKELSQSSRQLIEKEFSEKQISSRYALLYQDLLSGSRTG